MPGGGCDPKTPDRFRKRPGVVRAGLGKRLAGSLSTFPPPTAPLAQKFGLPVQPSPRSRREFVENRAHDLQRGKLGACNDRWRLRRRCCSDCFGFVGSEGDAQVRQVQLIASPSASMRSVSRPLQKRQCKPANGPCMVRAIRGAHDSDRIRFCRRYDGVDRLDSGRGPRRGRTQGTSVGAARSHKSPEIDFGMTAFDFIAIAALVVLIVFALANRFPRDKL